MLGIIGGFFIGVGVTNAVWYIRKYVKILNEYDNKVAEVMTIRDAMETQAIKEHLLGQYNIVMNEGKD